MSAGLVTRSRVERSLAALEAISLALSMGGIVTMGAIVAPAIFRTVPAPYSGDGMAVAFARYDRAALAALVVALLMEAARAVVVKRVSRADRARLAFVGVALVMAAFIALRITPAIAALHAQGAMRGVGELGEQLEAIHVLASRAGKVELAFEALVLVMLVVRPRDVGDRDDA